MIKLELTREQMDQLAPLFDRVREANREGQTVAIGAQVWRDGMVVRFFKEDQARALSAALGGDFDRIHYSAEERMEAATSGVPVVDGATFRGKTPTVNGEPSNG